MTYLKNGATKWTFSLLLTTQSCNSGKRSSWQRLKKAREAENRPVEKAHRLVQKAQHRPNNDEKTN